LRSLLVDSQVHDFEDGLVVHEGRVHSFFLGVLLAVGQYVLPDLSVAQVA